MNNCKWCNAEIDFVRVYGGEKTWIAVDWHTGEEHKCSRWKKRPWLKVKSKDTEI